MEGIEESKVTSWLEANIGGTNAPFVFEMVAGGRSNLTFKVTDRDGRAFALRRPPTSQVLPTAHDMGREYRVISALVPTNVPVPVTYGFCGDPDVSGAPFYIMEFVEGHILRDAPAAERLSVQSRRTASLSLIDTLATLHEVDPASVGLGDLGRHEGYISRQLERWYGQFKKSQAVTGRTVPEVDRVHDLLAGRIPQQQSTAIVHGDFRLDNTVLRDDGSVAAVLDWEICTLGDPLADLGLLMVYWAEPGDENPALGIAPTVIDGFASRKDLQSRYEQRSGKDLSDLGFYVSFGYWKLACILEGVYSRYSQGAAAGDRSDHEIFARQVGLLAAMAGEAAAAF